MTAGKRLAGSERLPLGRPSDGPQGYGTFTGLPKCGSRCEKPRRTCAGVRCSGGSGGCQDQAYAEAFRRLRASMPGISIDHVLCHAAFANDAQLRFPLPADFHPRGTVARRYGVYREAPGINARALVVLDRQSTIRFSEAYPDALNPGVNELLTILEALATEDNEAEPTREC